jgi:hypothetical protein
MHILSKCYEYKDGQFYRFNCLKTRERVGINNVFFIFRNKYFIKSKANWRALASAVKIEQFGKRAEKISFPCTAAETALFWSFDPSV